MFRLIILFVLLAVSFYIVRLVLSNRKRQHHLSKSATKVVRTYKQKNNMVRCLYCDLYLPEEEAIKQGDKVFCNQKHANQHQMGK
jgi:uncharacterized protein